MYNQYNQKYDWDEWFSKSRFTLKYKKHFDTDPTTMIQVIRNEASKRKISISAKYDVESQSVKVKVNA